MLYKFYSLVRLDLIDSMICKYDSKLNTYQKHNIGFSYEINNNYQKYHMIFSPIIIFISTLLSLLISDFQIDQELTRLIKVILSNDNRFSD